MGVCLFCKKEILNEMENYCSDTCQKFHTNEKVVWLVEHQNKYGDFFVCTHYKGGRCSQWKSVLWILEHLDTDAWRLEKANHRTPFRNELPLDFDALKDETPEQTKIRISIIAKELRAKGLNFDSYFTGSKGYHIHIQFFEADDIPIMVFRWIIKKYGADVMLASSRHMIALENCPHWKTGKPKQKVNL